MRLNILIILIVGFLGYAGTILLDRQSPPEIKSVPQEVAMLQRSAPEFSFTTLDGKTHKISDFEGKIIVLNFWATWCAPCIKEFPALLEVAAKNQDKLVLVALSSDLSLEPIDKFFKKYKFDISPTNVLIALDENQEITQKLFQTYRLPETIIIDQNQIMREKLVGARWKVEDLQKLIGNL